MLSNWQLLVVKTGETNALLTRFCPSMASESTDILIQDRMCLEEGEHLNQVGEEQGEPLRLGNKKGSLGKEKALAPAFLCLLWEAGSPAGACVDFETLPCRTGPKPWEGWPPPQPAASLLYSRNWDLSVGPSFRTGVSCHFPSVMWPLEWTKWAGMGLAARPPSRKGSGHASRKGEWLECG